MRNTIITTLLLVGILICGVVIGVIGINYLRSHSIQPQAEIATQPEMVTCYVNGQEIKATRETCANLSQTPTPTQIPVQRQPVYIQAPMPAPTIYIPPAKPVMDTTNCHEFYDGSISCDTKHY